MYVVPHSARAPHPIPLPKSQDLRALSPVGLRPSPGGFRSGPEPPDTRTPPLCLSRPLPSPTSFLGSCGACGEAKGASWPEIRLLGSPAPVSMATARAESAAPSRGGHAPAAAYVTRRAARSQAPGRIPARSGGLGRGRPIGWSWVPPFHPPSGRDPRPGASSAAGRFRPLLGTAGALVAGRGASFRSSQKSRGNSP